MTKQLRLGRNTIVILLCVLGLQINSVKAQEGLPPFSIEKLGQKMELMEGTIKKLQKFKVSGYIQTQYQYAETDADGINFKLANKANPYEKEKELNFGRFGVRRGRIKFIYEDGLMQGVFQPDFTEKGVGLKDVYLSVKDPWFKTNSFKTGIFDRPFGNEISYSSSRRESPERSRIFQSLFPDERDLGAMLTLQASKTSFWNFLKLESGLFAGNGIRAQFDSHMDFIGHLSVSKDFSNDVAISGGISAYLGSVLQTNDSIYIMENNNWKKNQNKNNYAKRQYIGLDAQFSTKTSAGLTQLRGEYLLGEHPGTLDGAYDFKLLTWEKENSARISSYMRKISGGYVILTQDLGTVPFTVVAKYDWYDQNTEVSGNDIKIKGEILMSNIGIGLLWHINPSLRLTTYYDIVKNEISEQVSDYKEDKKDNVFTLRLQYKF